MSQLMAHTLGQTITAQEAVVELQSRGYYPLTAQQKPLPASPPVYTVERRIPVSPPVSPTLVPVSTYVPPIRRIDLPEFVIRDPAVLPIVFPEEERPITPIEPLRIEPPAPIVEPITQPYMWEPVEPITRPPITPVVERIVEVPEIIRRFDPVSPVVIEEEEPVYIPISPPVVIKRIPAPRVSPIPRIPHIPGVPIEVQPADEERMIPDLPDQIRERELPPEIIPAIQRELEPEVIPSLPEMILERFPDYVPPYSPPISPPIEEELIILEPEKKGLIWILVAGALLLLLSGEGKPGRKARKRESVKA